MRAAALIIAGSVLVAGCSETPTSPTEATDTTPTVSTVQFVGSLTGGGSRFYSFTVTRTGTISATLASVTTATRGAAADVPLGLGIGRPAGVGCPTVTSLTTRATLTTQAQLAADAGVYCINVYDPGTLTASVNFVVRFSFP